MKKAIIFDFDDTLVTTLPTKILALQYIAKNIYNFELTEAFIREHWGKPYRELMRLLFLETKDDVDTIIRHYEQIRDNYQISFYEDVLETLEYLVKKVAVGILTASPRNLVLKDLQLLQFPYEKFFYIQTAEDTNVHKPNPDVFKPILQKLSETGIKKEQIIYVGDSLNDYLAAKGAGLQFCGIADRTTTKEEFRKNNVEVLTSLKELIPIIR